MLTTTRLPRALVALVVAALLAGCSSGTSDDPGPDGSPSGSSGESGSTSPSAEPTNYLKVPKAVTLTAPGSELKIGEKAAVAWQVDEKRVAALDLKVTKVQKVPIARLSAWVLDKESRTSTPYYVHTKLKNVGRSDLSGLTIPLYIAVGDNTLVSASSFESGFKPCPSLPLPKKFKPGKRASTCWVYLAPDRGSLESVTYFTAPGFVPITWTGKVQVIKEKKKDKKKAKKKN